MFSIHFVGGIKYLIFYFILEIEDKIFENVLL